MNVRDESTLTSTILLEMSNKLEVLLLNQAVIIRAVDPQMAKVIRPELMPSMPMKTVRDFKRMEKFLQVPANFSAMVIYVLKVYNGSIWVHSY